MNRKKVGNKQASQSTTLRILRKAWIAITLLFYFIMHPCAYTLASLPSLRGVSSCGAAWIDDIFVLILVYFVLVCVSGDQNIDILREYVSVWMYMWMCMSMCAWWLEQKAQEQSIPDKSAKR